MAGQILMLGQIAQGLSFGQNCIPLVWGQFSHNNPKESSFSGAVDADNGSLFKIFYMKGNIV